MCGRRISLSAIHHEKFMSNVCARRSHADAVHDVYDSARDMIGATEVALRKLAAAPEHAVMD